MYFKYGEIRLLKMMAEDDIAFLLNRGKLVEPHENEQAEINTIVDKSSQGIYLS